MKKIIIAVDGHSSCGKGTLARYLANELHYNFIDSGSMYRCVTLACLRQNIDIENEQHLETLINSLEITFVRNPQTGKNDTCLNGENVEIEIRKQKVADKVSQVARISLVRRKLVEKQQKLGEHKGVVMDGRDIGTVVFPNADLKIFMTASVEIRAQRRYDELVGMGIASAYEEVLENLKSRDRIDSSRADSPLTYNSTYKLLDNSDMTIQQQNKIALAWAKEAIEEAGRSNDNN